MTSADFLTTSPSPPADAVAAIAADAPERFLNRELSWLKFNWRVLEEAENPNHPLLERLRFLAISASNLDEFYMVRLAGLRAQVERGVQRLSADGLSPAAQLAAADAEARRLMAAQDARWSALREDLAAAGLRLLRVVDLEHADRVWLEERFMRCEFPALTALAIDPAHPFPFIANKGQALALSLAPREAAAEAMDALIVIPPGLSRFIRLPKSAGEPGVRFVAVEDVISAHMDRMFPGYDLIGDGMFRILRDSELDVAEEAEDLVREFETALLRRRRGEVIRLKISAGTPERLRRRLLEQLHVAPEEAVEVKGVIGLSDLSQLIVDDLPELRWRSFTPRTPERVKDHDGDIFAAVRDKDILIHHPYETFGVVVDFVAQAARDPAVVAIKQTLYRTSNQSPIVDALCEAAQRGKSVIALVELKARFDEAANIEQARRLERAGATVIYGFPEWKTHAKISLAARREGGEIRLYTHFGTGNYHPITAKVYTDLSFFTCDQALGRDATRVFNYVAGYARPDGMEKLAISPLTLKQRLLDHINEEIAHVAAGRPGRIWCKVNALIDPDMVDALYRASQGGVQTDLVARGVCGLRPGVPGLSDNIRVKSIVGRYLEHARIFCFGGGGGLPSPEAHVYVSSADLMGRNLNRRVEVLTPIENATVRMQIMDQVMGANLRDAAQSWLMDANGDYARSSDAITEDRFNCHRHFMAWPSLSGRGDMSRVNQPPLLTNPGSPS